MLFGHAENFQILKRESQLLDLLIPQVKVTSAENARITYGAQTVLLQPADNVEIIPDLEGSVGLLAAAVGDAELPDLSVINNSR